MQALIKPNEEDEKKTVNEKRALFIFLCLSVD